MITEFHQLITHDGQVFNLDSHARVGKWVISQAGWGMPPIRYNTVRDPLGGAELVKSYFLQPRTVELLIRQEFCGRPEYWRGRAAILEATRVNRGNPLEAAPVTLRRLLPDGHRRDLEVYLQGGLEFAPRSPGQWDEWAFTEFLRFIAYDPVITDPTPRVELFTLAPRGDLVFPIEFPLEFGGDTVDQFRDVTYAGTWLSHPVINLTGPLNNPIITNLTTGEKLELTYNIPSGEVVTLNLQYGQKKVEDNLGNNLIGTLTTDSDFATWHLAPDPEAPGGVNQLQVQGTQGEAGVTAIQVEYFERHIGF